MAEGTGNRLDTVDIADGGGWQVDSTHEGDVFVKGGVVIDVRYTANDDIESAVKRTADGVTEAIRQEMTDGVERLRGWLTGKAYVDSSTSAHTGGRRADFTMDADGWTRDDFIGAVTDPGGRAFLLRILELMDANSTLPRKGTHARLHFGKRPGGAVFFYPYGRRFPPFKLAVKAGDLMISGCWKGNFAVSGHAGFADLATILGQDETGSASAVSVFGLDPDTLWQVAENVSRAIN